MVLGFILRGNKRNICVPKRPIILPLKKHWAFQKHSTMGHEPTRRGTSEGMNQSVIMRGEGGISLKVLAIFPNNYSKYN
jgi:hypothetical protein